MHGIAGFLDVVEQDPRRTPRQLLHILPDGRQPGHTVLSQRDAVKTCDGNILRHTQPVIPQRTNCAERHQVVAGDEGGELRLAGRQELVDRRVTAVQPVVALDDQARVDLDADGGR